MHYYVWIILKPIQSSKARRSVDRLKYTKDTSQGAFATLDNIPPRKYHEFGRSSAEVRNLSLPCMVDMLVFKYQDTLTSECELATTPQNVN